MRAGFLTVTRPSSADASPRRCLPPLRAGAGNAFVILQCALPIRANAQLRCPMSDLAQNGIAQGIHPMQSKPNVIFEQLSVQFVHPRQSQFLLLPPFWPLPFYEFGGQSMRKIHSMASVKGLSPND